MGLSRVQPPVTPTGGLEFVKGHAYGNDFLLTDRDELPDGPLGPLARAICHRHHGVGADGLIAYRRTAAGASMTLRNADGSRAEVSGNGVRCLAAWLVAAEGAGAGEDIVVETEGGAKTLTLLDAAAPRYTFRAQMGQPQALRQERIDVGGEQVEVVVLSVGNPQCIVLVDAFEEARRRFEHLGPRLAAHARFPAGTNVELVAVERPDRLRILIWERGVGPTAASGTGACASAVAAAAFGGAARAVDVVSPGGSQRVEWAPDGIHLTGWAELVCRGVWLGASDAPLG